MRCVENELSSDRIFNHDFYIIGYESGEGKGEEGTDVREGGQPRRYRPRRRFEPNNYYNNRPRRPPVNRDSQGQDGVGILCTYFSSVRF